MTTAGTNEGFSPSNEHHSIVSCAATLTFNAPKIFVPDFQRGVRKATRGLELPIATPSFGVNITFDGMKIFLGVNRPVEPSSPPVGVEFVRSDDDGRLTWRHQALPGLISVLTHDYLRWKPFANETFRFVEALRGMYALDQLLAIKLEYIDRFAATWVDTRPDAWGVLQRDSRYMNPSIHDGTNLWHSQVGERYPLQDGFTRQRDVKIEVIDDIHPDGRKVRNLNIMTCIQDLLPAEYKYDDALAADRFGRQPGHVRVAGPPGGCRTGPAF